MTLTSLEWYYTFWKNKENRQCVRLMTASSVVTMHYKKLTL